MKPGENTDIYRKDFTFHLLQTAQRVVISIGNEKERRLQISVSFLVSNRLCVLVLILVLYILLNGPCTVKNTDIVQNS